MLTLRFGVGGDDTADVGIWTVGCVVTTDCSCSALTLAAFVGGVIGGSVGCCCCCDIFLYDLVDFVQWWWTCGTRTSTSAQNPKHKNEKKNRNKTEKKGKHLKRTWKNSVFQLKCNTIGTCTKESIWHWFDSKFSSLQIVCSTQSIKKEISSLHFHARWIHCCYDAIFHSYRSRWQLIKREAVRRNTKTNQSLQFNYGNVLEKPISCTNSLAHSSRFVVFTVIKSFFCLD